MAHAVVDTVSDGHGNKTLAAYIGAPIQEDSKVTTICTAQISLAGAGKN